jgi:acetolactate synthase-1/3 small subunit
LVKVKAPAKVRSEVMQICEIFRTKIVNVDHSKLIIELVGDSSKVTAFLDLLAPFGIVELARTGTLALKR